MWMNVSSLKASVSSNVWILSAVLSAGVREEEFSIQINAHAPVRTSTIHYSCLTFSLIFHVRTNSQLIHRPLSSWMHQHLQSRGQQHSKSNTVGFLMLLHKTTPRMWELDQCKTNKFWACNSYVTKIAEKWNHHRHHTVVFIQARPNL